MTRYIKSKQTSSASKQVNKQRVQKRQYIQKQDALVELQKQNHHLQNQLNHMVSQYHLLEEKNKRFNKLLLPKILKPLFKTEMAISSANRYRKGFQALVKEKGSIGKAYQTTWKIYKKQGFKATKKFLKTYFSNPVQTVEYDESQPLNLKNGLTILTTPHTYYIAKLFCESLKKIKIDSKVIFEMPREGYSENWHIVICPQIFEILPMNYIAFQMEQSVSSRWFNADYFARLKRAKYVFDYAIPNLEFLQKNSIEFSKIYYLPIDMLQENNEYQSNLYYEYDVAFYGDIGNCPRRQYYLDKLKEKFSVKVISGVFGKELHALLNKAKVIVNIHFYENALLETTRLYECLSLNKIIVSEEGSDQNDHTELENLIDFTSVGDVQAMIERVEFWLNQATAFQQRIKDIQVKRRQVSSFQFYFYRFLLAQDLLDFDTFYELCADYIKPKGDFWCLSLNESVQRQKDFNQDNHYNIWIFPGLRHNIGWIGCGLSYKFMLKIAEKFNLPKVTICEDDVLFDDNFEKRYSDIQEALVKTEVTWDIFSGFISDLSDTVEISRTNISTPNEKIYKINKLVSMVFNIYSNKVYEKIYTWNEYKRSTDNTIDRYIESHGAINGLVVSPFLVGHKEELHSTLWGKQNTIYNDLIDKSQKLLNERIAQLEKE